MYALAFNLFLAQALAFIAIVIILMRFAFRLDLSADRSDSRCPRGARPFGARIGYDATMAEALQPVSADELADLAYFIARQP